MKMKKVSPLPTLKETVKTPLRKGVKANKKKLPKEIETISPTYVVSFANNLSVAKTSGIIQLTGYNQQYIDMDSTIESEKRFNIYFPAEHMDSLIEQLENSREKK